MLIMIITNIIDHIHIIKIAHCLLPIAYVNVDSTSGLGVGVWQRLGDLPVCCLGLKATPQRAPGRGGDINWVRIYIGKKETKPQQASCK